MTSSASAKLGRLCRRAAGGLWSGSFAEGTVVSRNPGASAGEAIERHTQHISRSSEASTRQIPTYEGRRQTNLRRGTASRASGSLVLMARVHGAEVHSPHQTARGPNELIGRVGPAGLSDPAQIDNTAQAIEAFVASAPNTRPSLTWGYSRTLPW